MLQKFLVISNGGGERAQAQAQQIQVQQQAVSSSSSTAVAVVTEGEAGQVVQEQQRVSAVVAVEETTVELSLQSPLRAAGAEGEGQTSPRSPTPFAEETEGACVSVFICVCMSMCNGLIWCWVDVWVDVCRGKRKGKRRPGVPRHLRRKRGGAVHGYVCMCVRLGCGGCATSEFVLPPCWYVSPRIRACFA